MDGQEVLIRARIHTTRAQGSKMVFMNIRQRDQTLQVLMSQSDDKISKPMVKWVEHLPIEAIILLHGTVKKSPEPIKSATISDVEVHVDKLFLIAQPTDRPAFLVEDANRPDADFEKEDAQFNKVLLDTRLNNRVLDLRTTTNQAIFKLQAQVTKYFREYLEGQNFTEIHSPKLQGAATESGASVFKVSYFKGAAFLAQSPQLAKQMCIAADFERVYEVGPVFRAEDSNTHRHLTEFTGLDLEMAIEEHYHEAMEMLDGMLKHIFTQLKQHHQKEIDTIGLQFAAEEFKWKDETLKLSFAEAIELLNGAGANLQPHDDINTENEKKLGRIVKEKYDVDYYIIDKFPMALRPFYTMPDPNNPELSNSYDFFMRGEEILSGAQRVHVPKMLEEAMIKAKIDPASMKGYLDGFRMGCPPHAGGGIGLERVLMLFLKLNNIRRTSLFPRDPKRLEP
ncbi:aspartyl-tRNA synthetase [Peniophora sp. CONT]|nr:aspartyl-tRNA synthetase [Peniophora sp. CONT]